MALFLVTGGCGFIGSNLTHALVRRGDRVRVLDDLSGGRQQNIADLLAAQPGQVELWRGDICDAALLDRVLVDVDYVLHQAAVPSVPWSIERPLECQRVNVDGVLQVLDAARRQGRVRRFVFAASCAAYGDLRPDDPKREEDPVMPLSPYAAAKLAGEHLCTAYSRAYGMPTVALRYFNVFGPRQDPKGAYAAVIPCWISQMQNGEPVYINGDGGNTRDFCFVRDVVQALILASTTTNAEAFGNAFNVGLGKATDLNELFQTIRSLVQEASGKPVPDVIYRAFRAGDIRHSCASAERVETVYADVYFYPLGLAILLLLAEVFLSDAPRRHFTPRRPPPGRKRELPVNRKTIGEQAMEAGDAR